MNVKDIPVIDNHSHLFDVSDKNREMINILSLSLNEIPEKQLKNSLIYHKYISELKDLLDFEGGYDDVLTKRKGLLETDYKGYVKRLCQDVNMHTFIIDLGYKPASVSLEDFENILPCDVKYMYRIESIVDELWEDKVSFKKAEERFYDEIEKAKSTLDVVAIKSIIGYRTGLNIEKKERSLMKKENYTEKEFRDFFFISALEKAGQLNIPMQVHASFGESNIDLLKNNPLKLKSIIDDPKYSKTDIVLVHGGYPYSFEAGYLAAMYPNIYLDMSEMVPFVPLGMKKGLRDMIDMCPFNKLMFGSDGFVLPDIHWLAARMAKKEMLNIVKELIEEDYFNEKYGQEILEMVFWKNAKKVYNI
ncbi:MAG TPA: amidohydrolase family protein [Halanaerobiales bacterium]|nr:amidohydrolase family protein [Halanaerobiales bacterium]